MGEMFWRTVDVFSLIGFLMFYGMFSRHSSTALTTERARVATV